MLIRLPFISSTALILSVCFQPSILLAQRSRIAGPVENGRRLRLTGHLNPRAQAENDLGTVDSSEVLPPVTIVLRQTPEQQAELERLLAEQQDPSSPNYHQWLTPEEYADRFGVSAEDIAKITSWLEGQNLHVTAVGRARNWVSFSGTAAEIGNAFRTEFHRYDVNGRRHFANTTEPSIPVALQTAIRGIHGLNDFRLKPRAVRRAPMYTSGSGNHYLGPEDFATIYNVKPLHNAGIKGAGQKLAVAGQTQIDLDDLRQFRTRFGLPANDPDTILVPNTRDPGTNSDDLGEADLDIEWASAVAPEAKIIYVYSNDVMDAVQYVIDQNLAPVLSVSYGLCETQTSRSDARILQSWARQANAQGITWVNASGDSGGADCIHESSTSGAGLAVDIPASIPEVTGVGGTTFAEGSGNYWNTTNTSGGGSALSYIPETTWNDSTDGDPSAGGGGASAIFGKPTWQTGAGVPNDGARDVPDISLAASADHVGYIVYTEGKTAIFGGTSAGTPAFAGIATLLNQYLVTSGAQSAPGLGNMNPKLYSLAQTTPAIFHDVTTGHNMVTVTCSGRSRNCVSGSFGYNAGPGYDQATGLGSVDAYGLVTAWRNPDAAVSKGSASMTLAASSTTISRTDNVTLTATVTSANGGTPSGSVTFAAGSTALGSATLSGANGTATASLLVSNSVLASGANTIIAQYTGDSSYSAATASVVINVAAAVSSGTPSIAGVANAASFRQSFAPGMVVSIFGSNLAGLTWLAGSLPLPSQMAGVSATVNGAPAPLFYVSPTQLNVQIPYGTQANSVAILSVTNNGRTITTPVPVSAAAPGIFTNQNGALVPAGTAARGQIISLYLTGAGQVSPTIPSGSAPAAGTPVSVLPRPVTSARVTVGDIPAPIQFIGIPQGLVGVMQINFQVPVLATTGTQPVVVTIGGVSSPPATLTVTR